MAGGEILKLPVSEFQSSLASKLRLPFLTAAAAAKTALDLVVARGGI
jgi:hypothetical protein